MSIHDCVGKAVALALLSVSLTSCGNPFSDRLDAQAVGAEGGREVRVFYEGRDWQPAWDGGAEKRLIEILDGAAAHGLKPELFLKGARPEDREEREAVLTKAALRYASALATGYVDPKTISQVYTVERPKLDAAAGLTKALADGNLADWFASLAPRTDEYRTLSQEFVRYTRLNGNRGSAEAGERARQLAVNLERLRWLDRNPQATGST